MAPRMRRRGWLAPPPRTTSRAISWSISSTKPAGPTSGRPSPSSIRPAISAAAHSPASPPQRSPSSPSSPRARSSIASASAVAVSAGRPASRRERLRQYLRGAAQHRQQRKTGRRLDLGLDRHPVRPARPPQRPLQRDAAGGQRAFAQAETDEAMLGEAQQGHWIERIERRASGEADQGRDGIAGQRRAGGRVRRDAPAGQPRADPARQSGVGRHQGGGAAGRLQRLAQQERDGGRRLLLGAGEHDGKTGQTLGDRIDTLRRTLVAQPLDLGQPVGGRLGRPQRLVDQPASPAAARSVAGAPGRHLAALDPGAAQQPLQPALRMLFADLGPGRLGKVEIETGQHHRPFWQAGDHGQQLGDRRRTAGRAGGDHHLRRRLGAPALRQPAQQQHPALADVHQAELVQPPRPGRQRQLEEVGRDLPVLRQLVRRQAVDQGERTGLLDLDAVEEASQRVGQVQRAGGVEAAAERVLVRGDQPGQFVTAAGGRDRRRQVQGQVAWLERRLALVEVAQRSDLRQQHRAGAGDRQEGVGEVAARAAGRDQHRGRRQRLRAERGERRAKPAREVFQERPPCLDVEPARRRPGEEAHAVSRSRASAAATAAGSPTCIHWPGGETPNTRPCLASSRQIGRSENGSSRQPATTAGSAMWTPT